jgi:hypothetical protein
VVRIPIDRAIELLASQPQRLSLDGAAPAAPEGAAPAAASPAVPPAAPATPPPAGSGH